MSFFVPLRYCWVIFFHMEKLKLLKVFYDLTNVSENTRGAISYKELAHISRG